MSEEMKQVSSSEASRSRLAFFAGRFEAKLRYQAMSDFAACTPQESATSPPIGSRNSLETVLVMKPTQNRFRGHAVIARDPMPL